MISINNCFLMSLAISTIYPSIYLWVSDGRMVRGGGQQVEQFVSHTFSTESSTKINSKEWINEWNNEYMHELMK